MHLELGMTLIFVTHDLTIASLATRTVRMKDGQIVEGLDSATQTSRCMTFFTIVIRGLIRRPVRTGLTLLGISIGIGAVVALVGMA